MNPLFRNILAVIAGWIVGSIVNMALVMLGHKIFPVAGLDPSDMEAMKAVLPKLEAQFFIFPFLAHALGTLAGAFIAAKIAFNHKMKFALGIGVLFLLGGIYMAIQIPETYGFKIIDLVFAYIPMAWLGGRLAGAGKL